MQEPEPLLGEGQSQGTGAEDRHQRRRRLAWAASQLGLDAGGEAGWGRGLEESAQGQLETEGLP